MKYVMGDLHGEYDKFIRMLKLIDFKDSDTLHVIGDCIDRGDSGIQILQHIMNSHNIELIWGNHERLMMDFLESKSKYDEYAWLYNGGAYTYVNFSLLSKSEQTKLCEFIKNLPYYKILGKYILVHAGLDVPDNSSELTVEEIMQVQDKNDLVWIREKFYSNKAIDGYTVIFGHTPVVCIDESTINDDGEFSAWHDNKYGDKICIDCSASSPYGRLCCIRLDDLQEFYI